MLVGEALKTDGMTDGTWLGTVEAGIEEGNVLCRRRAFGLSFGGRRRG